LARGRPAYVIFAKAKERFRTGEIERNEKSTSLWPSTDSQSREKNISRNHSLCHLDNIDAHTSVLIEFLTLIA
jgi:hypothetical protein